MDAGLQKELEEKVLSGSRLTYDDGVALYASDDLAWLGELAHQVRTQRHGDAVYFNVNRHLNLTNVCSASCAYCSFERKPGQADAYTMRVEEAVEKALAMKDDGLTELHIVALKCFTATEVHWFEQISGLPADAVLDELIDAGLESLTGGGAEIFDW